jgi:putative transcriptional regulator
MSKLANDLMKSLQQALRHAKGDAGGVARITVVHVPDVRAIRRKLRMSQTSFASAYRIPLATLKNWEQGRRKPDAPAAAYLRAILRRPKAVREAVSD